MPIFRRVLSILRKKKKIYIQQTNSAELLQLPFSKQGS